MNPASPSDAQWTIQPVLVRVPITNTPTNLAQNTLGYSATGLANGRECFDQKRIPVSTTEPNQQTSSCMPVFNTPPHTAMSMNYAPGGPIIPQSFSTPPPAIRPPAWNLPTPPGILNVPPPTPPGILNVPPPMPQTSSSTNKTTSLPDVDSQNQTTDQCKSSTPTNASSLQLEPAAVEVLQHPFGYIKPIVPMIQGEIRHERSYFASCGGCGKLTSSEVEMHNHLRTCQFYLYYFCPFSNCAFNTYDRRIMRAHFATHHKDFRRYTEELITALFQAAAMEVTLVYNSQGTVLIPPYVRLNSPPDFSDFRFSLAAARQQNAREPLSSYVDKPPVRAVLDRHSYTHDKWCPPHPNLLKPDENSTTTRLPNRPSRGKNKQRRSTSTPNVSPRLQTQKRSKSTNQTVTTADVTADITADTPVVTEPEVHDTNLNNDNSTLCQSHDNAESQSNDTPIIRRHLPPGLTALSIPASDIPLQTLEHATLYCYNDFHRTIQADRYKSAYESLTSHPDFHTWEAQTFQLILDHHRRNTTSTLPTGMTTFTNLQDNSSLSMISGSSSSSASSTATLQPYTPNTDFSPAHVRAWVNYHAMKSSCLSDNEQSKIVQLLNGSPENILNGYFLFLSIYKTREYVDIRESDDFRPHTYRPYEIIPLQWTTQGYLPGWDNEWTPPRKDINRTLQELSGTIPPTQSSISHSRRSKQRTPTTDKSRVRNRNTTDKRPILPHPDEPCTNAQLRESVDRHMYPDLHNDSEHTTQAQSYTFTSGVIPVRTFAMPNLCQDRSGRLVIPVGSVITILMESPLTLRDGRTLPNQIMATVLHPTQITCRLDAHPIRTSDINDLEELRYNMHQYVYPLKHPLRLADIELEPDETYVSQHRK